MIVLDPYYAEREIQELKLLSILLVLFFHHYYHIFIFSLIFRTAYYLCWIANFLVLSSRKFGLVIVGPSYVFIVYWFSDVLGLCMDLGAELVRKRKRLMLEGVALT